MILTHDDDPRVPEGYAVECEGGCWYWGADLGEDEPMHIGGYAMSDALNCCLEHIHRVIVWHGQ